MKEMLLHRFWTLCEIIHQFKVWWSTTQFYSLPTFCPWFLETRCHLRFFQHLKEIIMSFEHSAPYTASYNGFIPPTGDTAIFVKDSQGRTLLLQDPSLNSNEAYERDLNELRQRMRIHDWYYHLRNELDSYTRGYHNEQAMLELVRRRGGIFQSIFEAEKRKHVSV